MSSPETTSPETTSPKTLRAGVVGLGWAGRQHMDAYAEQPDVELVALAGMEADQLELLGETYGIAPERRFATGRSWWPPAASTC